MESQSAISHAAFNASAHQRPARRYDREQRQPAYVKTSASMSRTGGFNGKKSTSIYGSQEIAAMSLDQLRQLSDLQLSERELADVIQAIHTGGSQRPEEGPDSDPHFASEQDPCLLCQQVQQFGPEHCLACQGSGSPEQTVIQMQHFASWVEWYQQYKLWAASQPLHLTKDPWPQSTV